MEERILKVERGGIMNIIKNVSNYAPYIQTIGTVIAALISAYALIKVNRANISDKIARSQWAFEMYVSFTGIYLVSEHNIDDYKKYKGFYFLFYAYADDQMKSALRHIDKLLRKNEMDKAEKKLMRLIRIYYKRYNLKKFSVKAKMNVSEQKQKINTILNKSLVKEDFEL